MSTEPLFGLREVIQLVGAVALAAASAVGTAWAMRGSLEKRSNELALAVEKVLQRVELLSQRWELLGQGPAEKLDRLETRLAQLEQEVKEVREGGPKARVRLTTPARGGK